MKTAYENASSEQREAMEKRIYREVVACQSALVDLLLEKSIVEAEEIENMYLEIEGQEEADVQEPLEWYLILEPELITNLKAVGEPILETEFGTWWGRTCSGQAIVLDSTFWDIYQDWITGNKWRLWLNRPNKKAR